MPSLAHLARQHAARLDGVEETVACAGTPLEQSSYRIDKKAFLFVQEKAGLAILRFKLDASLPDAQALAARDPDTCQAGKGGWITVRGAQVDAATTSTLRGWIDESYASMTGPAVPSSRPGSRKATSKEATSKEATSKKATSKKATSKKATSKKAATKKAASKKATLKKAASKKAATKKATSKKAATTKATSKKAATTKVARGSAATRKQTSSDRLAAR